MVTKNTRAVRVLQELPAGLAQHVVGATGPAHIGRWARFHEIKAWLDRHAPLADWRALDDAVFEFPKPCSQLIACHPQEGFGPRQAQELARWLGARSGATPAAASAVSWLPVVWALILFA